MDEVMSKDPSNTKILLCYFSELRMTWKPSGDWHCLGHLSPKGWGREALKEIKEMSHTLFSLTICAAHFSRSFIHSTNMR